MDTIDLRSDTVTWPTEEMRVAMARAEVGDDVYGDDPTLNRLEAEAADMLGKPAALFVTSGTMGNLCALLTHCRRGEEVILGKHAHIFLAEAANAAAFGGLQLHATAQNQDGTLEPEAIEAAIRTDDEHEPRSRLVALENTQGTLYGVPLGAAYTDRIGELARSHGLKLHVDGARIFNAAAALGTPARDLVAAADSVSFCLSKGLCAPVGSLLLGDADFIHEARRTRKALGGGLRQVGVLAAAGLVALRRIPQRLHEDHVNACALAEGLIDVPYVSVDPTRVYTNMVYLELAPEAPLTVDELAARLLDEYNVRIARNRYQPRVIRLVTHYWVRAADVDQVLTGFRQLLS